MTANHVSSLNRSPEGPGRISKVLIYDIHLLMTAVDCSGEASPLPPAIADVSARLFRYSPSQEIRNYHAINGARQRRPLHGQVRCAD